MFSEKVINNLSSASWIRAMFEQGELLRQKYGAENVFDFTLGNPDALPPEAVQKKLVELVSGNYPEIHKYMANAGYMDVRTKIAQYTSKETGVQVNAENVLMVSGAAGGLNVIFKALLNPGDEVIAITPFFPEYKFYVDNHGGKIVLVPSLKDIFQLDICAIEKAITSNTKAIILNSPNNPSGAVYNRESLDKLACVLKNKELEIGSQIYVISDEPYVKLVYDNTVVPPVLSIFKNSIIVNSFSKSLSLPGERIGYIAINPAIKDADLLMSAMIFCNRTLGYVNAPSLFQKVIADNLDLVAGVDKYKERRDELYKIITEAGFKCELAKGAFYLFVKSPIENDGEFAKDALTYNLIVVGGTGFGTSGYFRLAYCVSMETIKKSKSAFNALGKKYGLV